MLCKKNGVGADFGHGHVYNGDLYECPVCGIEVLFTNRGAMFDPEHKLAPEYIEMTSKQSHIKPTFLNKIRAFWKKK